MKSEKIILQCIRDQADKFDLTFRREPNAYFFDLPTRYTSLHYQWGHVDSCRSGACRGESRQRTFGPRSRSDPVENRREIAVLGDQGTGIAH